MTIRSTQWTRRQFSQGIAATAAAAILVKNAPAQENHLAFAATADNRLHVYRANASRWTLLHEAEAISPAHLVLHPTMPILYVLHDVDQWENLPRGAVSAYRINQLTGALKHLNTQPLSLSATNPRHAVLSADNKSLFVAAHSGGIYNQLPIATDGTLQTVSAIRKEYGTGEDDNAKVATPLTTARHTDGSIFTIDPGQETVSRFDLSAAEIKVRHRTRVHTGSGPSQIALSAHSAYVMHADSGSIAHHAISESGLSNATQTIAANSGEMKLHPSGRFLVVSGENRTQIVSIDAHTGSMSEYRTFAHGNLKSVQFSKDGSTLTARQANAIVSIPFDTVTGELGKATSLATVKNCTTLLHTA